MILWRVQQEDWKLEETPRGTRRSKNPTLSQTELHQVLLGTLDHRYDLWFPLNLELVAEQNPSGLTAVDPDQQVVQTDSWWRSGSSFPPSHGVTTLLLWRLKRGEEWLSGGSDAHRDLDLTHWEPHHLRLMDRNSGLFTVFPVFLTSPRQSSCPFYFTGVCSSTFQFDHPLKRHLFIVQVTDIGPLL